MTALDGVYGTVCNAQQYQQSLQSYNSRSPSLSCLPPGDRIGLVLAAETSVLSFISVITIFIWICWNVHWYNRRFPTGSWKLFQGPTDIYMFMLFVFDFLQAIGGMLNIRWAHSGIVTTGPYCTAQGLIEQMGELGVALITLLLAVHTFVTAVLPIDLRGRGVAFGLVCLACVFIILWVAIGPGIYKHYETPTPYWCWISPQFPRERLAGEYIWLWISLSISAILYIPLHFRAEGFWSIDERYRFHWWKPAQRVKYAHRGTALGMLLYPLAYSFIVLPITIARWLLFSHHDVSPAATFFAISIFYLSGAINVLLFFTRPKLLLFPRPEELQVDIQEMQLGPIPQGPVLAIISDREKIQHSPEPSTSAALGEGSSRDVATPSRDVSSRRISDDI